VTSLVSRKGEAGGNVIMKMGEGEVINLSLPLNLSAII